MEAGRPAFPARGTVLHSCSSISNSSTKVQKVQRASLDGDDGQHEDKDGTSSEKGWHNSNALVWRSLAGQSDTRT